MDCIQTITIVVWPQLGMSLLNMPFCISFDFLLAYIIFNTSVSEVCLVALRSVRGCSYSNSIHQMAVVGGLAGATAFRLLPHLSSAQIQMVLSHTLTVCHIFPPAMSLLISIWNCCRWLPQMNARALGELKQIKSFAGPPMCYCLLQEEGRNPSLPWTDQKPHSYSPEVGHLSSSLWAESNLTYVHQMVDSHNYYSAG